MVIGRKEGRTLYGFRVLDRVLGFFFVDRGGAGVHFFFAGSVLRGSDSRSSCAPFLSKRRRIASVSPSGSSQDPEADS